MRISDHHHDAVRTLEPSTFRTASERPNHPSIELLNYYGIIKKQYLNRRCCRKPKFCFYMRKNCNVFTHVTTRHKSYVFFVSKCKYKGILIDLNSSQIILKWPLFFFWLGFKKWFHTFFLTNVQAIEAEYYNLCAWGKIIVLK